MNPAEKLVHSYDTERHANRCGLPGQTSSTKHSAGVTCPACRRLLAGEDAGELPTTAANAAAPRDDGAAP